MESRHVVSTETSIKLSGHFSNQSWLCRGFFSSVLHPSNFSSTAPDCSRLVSKGEATSSQDGSHQVHQHDPRGRDFPTRPHSRYHISRVWAVRRRWLHFHGQLRIWRLLPIRERVLLFVQQEDPDTILTLELTYLTPLHPCRPVRAWNRNHGCLLHRGLCFETGHHLGGHHLGHHESFYAADIFDKQHRRRVDGGDPVLGRIVRRYLH